MLDFVSLKIASALLQLEGIPPIPWNFLPQECSRLGKGSPRLQPVKLL